jgi:hypothetical protein
MAPAKITNSAFSRLSGGEMNRFHFLIRWSWAALLSLPLLAFGESGVVPDVSTNKPVANAVVVATWHAERMQTAQRHGECYRAEVTRSDDQGRFSISAFSGNLNPLLMDRQRSVFAVSKGFQQELIWSDK